MKRFLAVCVMLCCWTRFGVAQFQGNVKFSGRATGVVTGHSVTLSWVGSPGATSYCVYRGTTQGGPYTKIAWGIAATNYTDVRVTHKQTLYYVSTAVNGGNESGYSNETEAVVP